MGGPCFVFLYEQIPARGALIALDLTHFAPVEAASSSLPATFQKENTILTDGVSFCDYPQVLSFAPSHIARKGECEGEPFAGFPTRVQSPARRRPLLRSKSAAPKKKDTHVGVFLFCDCPQVLLFVRLAYRKSKKRNEARLATGIPRMAEPFAGALPDLLI